MKQGSQIKRIIISRTDSIGDVVLTLPVAGVLREKFPGAEILFLGKTYTQPVVACCKHISRFMNRDEIVKMPVKERIDYFTSLDADVIVHVFPDREVAQLAKKARIPMRIGTSHRIFHLSTCNFRPGFTRKNSDLHEAQLNFKLLAPLGIEKTPSFDELNRYLSFENIYLLPEKWKNILQNEKKKIILHPKSKGSAREWSLDNFSKLIALLHKNNYQVFVSGTGEEKNAMKDFLEKHKNEVTDIAGELSLVEFIAFINACDILVAASTGPLHIAAVLNKKAIGIYPPMRPIHPGRWKPLGQHAVALSVEKICSDCRKSGKCSCLNNITAINIMNCL